jgi:DNA-binding transcriptional LysR family regulator
LELRHLRYFLAVAEDLSFRAAAERLHVAQAALSQTVRDLEEEVGARLLDRSSRHVALTPAGGAFQVEAAEIVKRAGYAVELARRAAQGKAGKLAVGFLGSAVSLCLPRVVRQYRERYPNVELELIEMTPERQQAALREGRIHLGLSRAFGPAAAREFEETLVYSDRLCAVLCSGHPQSASPRVRLRDLANDPFVLFARAEAPGLFDTIAALCREAGFSPRVVAQPTAMATVLTLVEAQAGVSIAPACTRNLASRGLAFRPLSPASPRIDLKLIRKRAVEPPTARAFREVLFENIEWIRQTMEG